MRELLAAEAVGEQLSAGETGEIRELLSAMPFADRIRERRGFDEAAALAQAAFLAGDRANWRRMPDALRARLLAMSRARAADWTPPRANSVARRVNWPARWGWSAATAVALAWLVFAVLPPLSAPPPQPDRMQALAQAADAITLPWMARTAGYEEVQGEIFWSDSLQAGEMRFRGLPANDPAREQYQLWIVDPDRHENPVDGGVFDASGDGELLVPVDARLPVDAPVAFAVTLEPAGGVVVSKGPMLLVAADKPRPDRPL